MRGKLVAWEVLYRKHENILSVYHVLICPQLPSKEVG